MGDLAAPLPRYERTVKAFWAGYRNLGKSPDGEPNSLKETFTLTELAPRPKIIGDFATELSGYLMRSNSGEDYKKHYLDLQLQLVNYAIFFTTFIPWDHGGPGSGPPSGYADRASCGVRKAAIPVAGYPLGFVKNPDILTYYAVKGESYFTGLMNPFTSPIKMVAYAAAKPFGGRIGPYLFKMDDEGKVLYARSGGNRLSFSYLTGLVGLHDSLTSDPNASEFKTAPIPSLQSFWVQGLGSDVIGGVPAGGDDVTFSVPNMPLDFISGAVTGFTGAATSSFQPIKAELGGISQANAGLYAEQQFFAFKPDTLMTGAAVGNEEIRLALNSILRPTAYEAANYLIPAMERHHQQQGIYSIGPLPSRSGDLATRETPLDYQLYAPLVGAGLLFSSPNDLADIIEQYLERNAGAVERYLRALKHLAVVTAGADVLSNTGVYTAAAGAFHSAAVDPRVQRLASDSTILQQVINDSATTWDKDCQTMAGKFNYFYFKESKSGSVSNFNKCPPALKDAIIDHWNAVLATPSQGESFKHYFSGRYIWPQDVESSGHSVQRYMTGYLPGYRQGAQEEGGTVSQLTIVGMGGNENNRRNHYSVKFVSLKSVANIGPGGYGSGSFPLLGEDLGQHVPAPPSDFRSTGFKNPLDPFPGDAGEVEY